MSMKPILFNTEMVRAILDSRKTVTRRVVKDIEPSSDFVDLEENPYVIYANDPKEREYQLKGLYATFERWDEYDEFPMRKAPYRSGDILYVRETWKQATIDPAGGGYALQDIFLYKADGDINTDGMLVEGRWHPSIHMPKEAARIFLRVTSVRVERLQKPFFEQGSCIFALRNEGVEISELCQQCIENYGSPCCNDLDPDLELNEETGEDESGGSECGILDDVRYDFSRLWDSTIKPADCDRYGWDANPWVWVIEFERMSKEEVMSIAEQNN